VADIQGSKQYDVVKCRDWSASIRQGLSIQMVIASIRQGISNADIHDSNNNINNKTSVRFKQSPGVTRRFGNMATLRCYSSTTTGSDTTKLQLPLLTRKGEYIQCRDKPNVSFPCQTVFMPKVVLIENMKEIHSHYYYEQQCERRMQVGGPFY
jgi:hypothetical protein